MYTFYVTFMLPTAMMMCMLYVYFICDIYAANSYDDVHAIYTLYVTFMLPTAMMKCMLYILYMWHLYNLSILNTTPRQLECLFSVQGKKRKKRSIVHRFIHVTVTKRHFAGTICSSFSDLNQ